jgi:hypothetical protein
MPRSRCRFFTICTKFLSIRASCDVSSTCHTQCIHDQVYSAILCEID